MVGNFPSECQYVLETLGGVYANDAVTKARKMTPAERLEFHQQHSQPLMEGLKAWMEEQFRERKVEPNSGLGLALRRAAKVTHQCWFRVTPIGNSIGNGNRR